MLSREDFWQFACEFYSRPQMQSRLLNLQDTAGKNINLCLLLCYLDSLTLTISPSTFTALVHTAKQFDEAVLQPQRAIRTTLKAHHQDYEDYKKLRAAMLAAELELEKRQQALLLETLKRFSLAPLQSDSNVLFYLSPSEYSVLFNTTDC
ncbi:TIGR02444 family protein [Pseudoalteromonas piscicida]|uniref:TIGR02444 family protein n=1 Tax=Pseudoalteromonas piscicida TaxID=43662 RepID=A0AAD0RFS6_PSEO7|nr:TIGR02444 family protein [Pseudoalteromonas piscicida]ASD65758.1 TIGR02444 family protein [Pseudoalteromonas piscicida]AXQ96512.1 TIGR02444 family protein [Pseudoalteromonas piscicida]AXR00793.1 TIGR02444 family protein [Pseudoalteromonas piscicida]